MQHDYNIGANCQRFIIAGFLISTIPLVYFVTNDVFYSKFACHSNCVVLTVIVDKDYMVNYVKGNLGISLFKSLFRIISRKYNCNFFTLTYPV